MQDKQSGGIARFGGRLSNGRFREVIVEVGGFQLRSLLFVQESGNDIQEDGENDRNQDRTGDWKIKRAILPFDANISRQASKRDSKFRGEKHSPTDEE